MSPVCYLLKAAGSLFATAAGKLFLNQFVITLPRAESPTFIDPSPILCEANAIPAAAHRANAAKPVASGCLDNIFPGSSTAGAATSSGVATCSCSCST